MPSAAEIMTFDDGGEAEAEEEGWEEGGGEIVFSAGKMKKFEKKKSASPWGEDVQVYKVDAFAVM